jgi:O-antigen ligase
MRYQSGIIASLSLLVVFVFNPFGVNLFALPKIVFLGIFVGLVLLALSLQFLIKKKITFRYNYFVYGLIALWIFSLGLSIVFSIAPLTSFWGSYVRLDGFYSQILYLLLFVMFLHFLVKEKDQTVFLKILLGVSVVTSLHAILQSFGFDVFYGYDVESFMSRSFSTFGNPNFLGQFLLVPIFMSVYFFLKTKSSKNKIAVFLIFAIMLLALFLTKNRASVLGLSVGFLFFFLFNPWIRVKMKSIFISLLLFVSGGAVFLFASSLRSINARFFLWESAVEVWKGSPWIGFGLETFRFTHQTALNVEIADRAHNVFLDVAVRQGFFGVMIYLVVLIALFVLFLRNRKKKDLLLLCSFSALISIFVSEFFGFSTMPNYVVFFALIAIILNRLVKFRNLKINNFYLGSVGALLIIAFSILNIVVLYRMIFADVVFRRGEFHVIVNEDYEKGFNYLDSAVKINPCQDNLHYRYAEYLSSLDSLEYKALAIEMVEKGGNFDNYSFIYYFTKGQIYLNFEEYEEAEKYFKKSLMLAPRNFLIMGELENLKSLM